MENIKIAVQAQLAALKEKSAKLGAAIDTALASNKEAILSSVDYAVSQADGITTSGCGKDIAVQNFAQLKADKTVIDRWVSRLGIAAQEQLEVSGAEAEQIAGLLIANETPSAAKARVDVSVTIR